MQKKSIKDSDNEISTWNDCRAGREGQSKILTKLLLNRFRYLNGRSDVGAINTFSLNIDAPWGMGKTFFIERWAKDLSDAGHITLFFNAWEHDYSKDPLTSLLATLYSQIDSKLVENKTSHEKVKQKLDVVAGGMKNIIRRSVPAIVGAASFATMGVPLGGLLTSNPKESGMDEAAGKVMEALGKEFANELFNSKSVYLEALTSFKEAMQELIEQIGKHEKYKLPIFVFIDDLDRCRPDFTLEVIECVKHILEIDGLYFVFATDTEQLHHSIKSVYGNGFDGERYLKKIFNRECSLIRPDQEIFSDHLFSEGRFNSKSLNLETLIFPEETESVNAGLSKWFSVLSNAYNLDLRRQIACRDQIEDLLNLRLEENTLVLVLLHLVILWNVDKKKAESQVSNQDLENQDFCSDVIATKTIQYNQHQSGRQAEIKISQVLTYHYNCLGKAFRKLHEMFDGARNDVQKHIFSSALCFTSNTGRPDEPEKVAEFDSLFEQIKMVS